MITPAYAPTATERVLPRLALDFTTAVLDSRVTVTRALNTATRVDSSGNIVGVNADLPRFDYNPSTLVCKGLLIEEARTNVLLNSLLNGTNLSTQSVTLSAVSYTLSFYGTGSMVISGGHSATIAGTGTYPSRRTYTFTPTAGSTTFTVSGTVQYAQLEAGAFATSFIPTGATSLTRNADVVSMTGTNFSSWYNASEGAFEADYACYVATNTSNSKSVFTVSDGTTSNRLYMNLNTAGTPFFFVNNAGATQANINTGVTLADSANAKSAGAYKLNSFAAATNGSAAVLDTAGTVPTVDRFFIGSLNGGQQLNGYFRKLMYWPQRITDAETRAFSK